MAYEQKELSGSLFKNEDREKETHPNLKGSALIGGVEYWISGWIKDTKKGDKWISLAFKRKDGTGGQKEEPRRKGTVDDLGSDIPFDNPYRGIRSYVV